MTDVLSVEVTIRTRTSLDGHLFSEIHYVFREGDGPVRHALTRLTHAVSDSAYQRNHEAQQFAKRRAPGWGAQ